MESNPRLPLYKRGTLPLSYIGLELGAGCESRTRIICLEGSRVTVVTKPARLKKVGDVEPVKPTGSPVRYHRDLDLSSPVV